MIPTSFDDTDMAGVLDMMAFIAVAVKLLMAVEDDDDLPLERGRARARSVPPRDVHPRVHFLNGDSPVMGRFRQLRVHSSSPSPIRIRPVRNLRDSDSMHPSRLLVISASVAREICIDVHRMLARTRSLSPIEKNFYEDRRHSDTIPLKPTLKSQANSERRHSENINTNRLRKVRFEDIPSPPPTRRPLRRRSKSPSLFAVNFPDNRAETVTANYMRHRFRTRSSSPLLSHIPQHRRLSDNIYMNRFHGFKPISSPDAAGAAGAAGAADAADAADAAGAACAACAPVPLTEEAVRAHDAIYENIPLTPAEVDSSSASLSYAGDSAKAYSSPFDNMSPFSSADGSSGMLARPHDPVQVISSALHNMSPFSSAEGSSWALARSREAVQATSSMFHGFSSAEGAACAPQAQTKDEAVQANFATRTDSPYKRRYLHQIENPIKTNAPPKRCFSPFEENLMLRAFLDMPTSVPQAYDLTRGSRSPLARAARANYVEDDFDRRARYLQENMSRSTDDVGRMPVRLSSFSRNPTANPTAFNYARTGPPVVAAPRRTQSLVRADLIPSNVDFESGSTTNENFYCGRASTSF